MTKVSATSRMFGAMLLIGFVACVPLSNWLIGNVGVECIPDGPCLVPVFPGILAPSGVLIAGLAFVLRDLVQERVGVIASGAAILVGGLLSMTISSPTLAMASVTSYVIAETADLAIFTALRRRGFVPATIISSIGGLAIDSLIFVYLAFGSLEHLEGQILGKVWALLVAIPLIAVWKRRRTRVFAA